MGRGVPMLTCLALLLSLAILAPSAPAPPEVVPHVEPLHHKNYTEKLGDSKVEFDMIAIPGGTFVMGSPDAEPGRGRDEGPQHPVRVRPFWMGKTEVTWNEFDVYRENWSRNSDNEEDLRKNADAVTRPTPPYIDETRGFGREGYPVISLSHHAAMEYCYWLTLKTGKAYRLPTETEWEWACRAGTTTAYSFGDRADKLGDYAWYEKNSEESTHPVGQKKPNPWGLYDLYGNVAEWCLDEYQKDFYGTLSLTHLSLNPVKKPGANRYPHAVRGGSYADPAARCRSAARLSSDPSWNKIDPDRPQSIWWVNNTDFIGFRVVRAVEEYTELKGIRSKVTRQSR